MIIHQMTRPEIDALLADCRLGRLACVQGERPYVVPIHFAFAENHLYSFSQMGQKIAWMRANPHVCVQADRMTDNRTWRSVVVEGLFEELPENPRSRFDRGHAWDLLKQHANWWEPGGLKPSEQAPVTPEYLFYRIRIETVTGRQATFDAATSDHREDSRRSQMSG
jgi:nitroimidazol reductase NimA-like FMN-containing flavoprotein (pyridoxamine 5'-phosphate oxidase superfamily)